jgi:hypothetical protein
VENREQFHTQVDRFLSGEAVTKRPQAAVFLPLSSS